MIGYVFAIYATKVRTSKLEQGNAAHTRTASKILLDEMEAVKLGTYEILPRFPSAPAGSLSCRPSLPPARCNTQVTRSSFSCCTFFHTSLGYLSPLHQLTFNAFCVKLELTFLVSVVALRCTRKALGMA